MTGTRTVKLIGAVMDHGFQSLVNLGLSISIARAVSVSEFGAFSVAFAFLTIAWGAWRSFAIEPYLSRNREALSQSTLGSTIRFLRLTLLCSLPATAIGLMAAPFLTVSVKLPLIALILISPIIVALDVLRSIRIGSGKPFEATLVSMTWAVLFFCVVLILSVVGENNLNNLLIGYALSAFGACVLGFARLKPGKGLQDKNTTLQSMQKGYPLFFEFIVGSGVIHLLSFALAAIASVDQAAGFRGAMILAGVLTTLIGGLRMGLFSDAIRYAGLQSDVNWSAYIYRTLPAIFALGSIVTMISLWLSYRFGIALLGETWILAKPVVLPFMLLCQMSILHLVASSVLRARNEYQLLLKITSFNAPVYLTLGVVGAYVAGAEGAAWGALLNTACMGPLLIWFSIRSGKSNLAG